MTKFHLSKIKGIGSAGDTIVEVLISIAVLGIAIAVAYNIAIASAQRIENSQLQSQVTEYIQDQIELIRTFGAPPSAQCYTPINAPSQATGSCAATVGNNTYTMTITSGPLSGEYNVTIIWRNLSGALVTQSAYYVPPS